MHSEVPDSFAETPGTFGGVQNGQTFTEVQKYVVGSRGIRLLKDWAAQCWGIGSDSVHDRGSLAIHQHCHFIPNVFRTVTIPVCMIDSGTISLIKTEWRTLKYLCHGPLSFGIDRDISLATIG